MEQVTIPAGTFKAYKLVRSESWSTGPSGTRGSNTTIYFYSPETRSIVKRSTENENNPGTVETELIKFYTRELSRPSELSKRSNSVDT